MAGNKRGALKIFLGYAAGVVKTYKMLEEAHNLKSQGVDIVIGYFEPHARKDTIAKAEGRTARAGSGSTANQATVQTKEKRRAD